MRGDRLSPQGGDPPVAASRREPAARSRPAGPLWAGGRGEAAPDLGSGGVSMVSPPAGVAAHVGPLGVSALADSARRRRAAADDEPAPHGSLPAPLQVRAAQAAIRPNETGESVRAGPADRSGLGPHLPPCESARQPSDRHKTACGRCPTCGRPERAHKVVGKPHRTRFPTAPTRLFIFSTFGNRTSGATMSRPVTVTYGLTGPR